MDLLRDLKKIAEKFLSDRGIRYDNSLPDNEIIYIYVNAQLRLIPLRPREVIRSSKIQLASLDHKTLDVLNEIEQKSIQGLDLNPHLSKTSVNGEFTDLLFSDWGIYHFHLDTVTDGGYFIKRTKDVLFLAIFKDVVYFIDIKPHGRDGEKHVFARKELLETIIDEWPEILESFRSKTFVATSHVVDDPEEIEKLRKAGTYIMQNIRGGVYSPMGGGITTAQTSGKARIESDRLVKKIRNAEQSIKDNFITNEEDLLKIDPSYIKGSAQFKLQLTDNGFNIIEKQTQYSVQIQNQSFIPML